MSISTDVSSILSYCETLPEHCEELARTASKIVSGWQHVDKLRMDMIIQSTYHIHAALVALMTSTKEITRVEIVPNKSRLEDIRYEDFEDLTPTVLQQRTELWYAACQELCRDLSFVVKGLSAVGASPPMIQFLLGRVWTDLMFFERQYKKACGVDLPSSLLLSSGQ